jgi:hypothetical protein
VADRAQEIIAETVGTESTAARAIAAQVGERLRNADSTNHVSEVDRS